MKILYTQIQSYIGPNGKVPILIRDDDTNFFTKPEMLESIFSKAWDRGFKVSLSVIPIQKGINDLSVPPEYRKSNLYYSIGDNHFLTKYLRNKIQNGMLEILQHGVDHSYDDSRRGEFAGNSNTREQVLKGKKILADALGIDPMFFVPPGEDISNRNIDLILNAGMTPIIRNTVFDTFLRYPYLPIVFKNLGLKLINFGNSIHFKETTLPLMKPVKIKLDKNYLSWSLRMDKFMNLSSIDAVTQLTEILVDNSNLSRDPVCILNHYHSYYYDWNSTITKSELFKTWNNVLKSFDDLSFGWKVDFGTLLERYRKIKNVLIAKTGSKVTVQSDELIRDYSFRAPIDLEQSNHGSLDTDTRIYTIKQIDPQKKIVLHEKT